MHRVPEAHSGVMHAESGVLEALREMGRGPALALAMVLAHGEKSAQCAEPVRGTDPVFAERMDDAQDCYTQRKSSELITKFASSINQKTTNMDHPLFNERNEVFLSTASQLDAWTDAVNPPSINDEFALMRMLHIRPDFSREKRERLNVLQRKASRAIATKPTIVSLPEHANADDLLRELSGHTGFTFDLSAVPDAHAALRSLRIDETTAAYTPSLERICKHLNAYPAQYAPERTVVLQPNDGTHTVFVPERLSHILCVLQEAREGNARRSLHIHNDPQIGIGGIAWASKGYDVLPIDVSVEGTGLHRWQDSEKRIDAPAREWEEACFSCCGEMPEDGHVDVRMLLMADRSLMNMDLAHVKEKSFGPQKLHALYDAKRGIVSIRIRSINPDHRPGIFWNELAVQGNEYQLFDARGRPIPTNPGPMRNASENGYVFDVEIPCSEPPRHLVMRGFKYLSDDDVHPKGDLFRIKLP